MKLFCMPLVAGVLATASVADVYVWESFTDASGGYNTATGGNGSGNPGIVVVSGSPIVASSGNLYSFMGTFGLHLYGAGFVTNPTMQIENLGNPFDTSSFFLMSPDTPVPVVPAVTETIVEGTPFSTRIYDLEWDYTGVATFFNMETADTSASLDRLTLGTFGETVPAPGALALLGLAGLGRRRRS